MRRVVILRVDDDAATHLPMAYQYETPGEALEACWTLPADDQAARDLRDVLTFAQAYLVRRLMPWDPTREAGHDAIARIKAAAGLDEP